MQAEEIKKNLNEMVVYKGVKDVYRLTAGIFRKGKNGYYYQVELQDTVHGNSIAYGKLEDVEGVKEC